MSGSVSQPGSLSVSDALSSACFFPSWPEYIAQPVLSASGSLAGGVDASGTSTAGQARLGVDAFVPLLNTEQSTSWSTGACGGVTLAGSSNGYGGTSGYLGAFGAIPIGIQHEGLQDRLHLTVGADSSRFRVGAFHVMGRAQTPASTEGVSASQTFLPGRELFLGAVAHLRSVDVVLPKAQELSIVSASLCMGGHVQTAFTNNGQIAYEPLQVAVCFDPYTSIALGKPAGSVSASLGGVTSNSHVSVQLGSDESGLNGSVMFGVNLGAFSKPKQPLKLEDEAPPPPAPTCNSAGEPSQQVIPPVVPPTPVQAPVCKDVSATFVEPIQPPVSSPCECPDQKKSESTAGKSQKKTKPKPKTQSETQTAQPQPQPSDTWVETRTKFKAVIQPAK